MNASRAAAILLMTLSGASSSLAAPPIRLIVVAASSQTVSDLSSGDLRRIYIGQMTRWPDGRRIVPVMLPPRSHASEAFLKHIVRMSAIDFAQEWIGAVFRGRAPAPPVVIATQADVLRFVASHSEAVAVISDEQSSPIADAHPGVRILTIDGHSPRASGYPLIW